MFIASALGIGSWRELEHILEYLRPLSKAVARNTVQPVLNLQPNGLGSKLVREVL